MSLHTSTWVGLENPRPNYGLEQDPLDWQKLMSMSEEDRNALVVKRANFLPRINSADASLSRGFNDALSTALKENAYSMERPSEPLEMPLELLQQMFPMPDGQRFNGDMIIQARNQYNPDQATLYQTFTASIERFGKTELCTRLKDAVRELFKQTYCDKIVVFGASFISCPAHADSEIATKHWTQHAALLAIREVWKENHGGHIPIYLQDPQYWEIDREVLGQFQMDVVNGDFGHEMGWRLLDETTLLVDFRTVFPGLYNLFVEITRPAAILSDSPLEPEYFADLPFSYTLRHNDREVVVPGLGISGSVALEIYRTEYVETKLNTDNLDFGELGRRVGADGIMFRGGEKASYLGWKPCIYKRRA